MDPEVIETEDVMEFDCLPNDFGTQKCAVRRDARTVIIASTTRCAWPRSIARNTALRWRARGRSRVGARCFWHRRRHRHRQWDARYARTSGTANAGVSTLPRATAPVAFPSAVSRRTTSGPAWTPTSNRSTSARSRRSAVPSRRWRSTPRTSPSRPGIERWIILSHREHTTTV